MHRKSTQSVGTLLPHQHSDSAEVGPSAKSLDWIGLDWITGLPLYWVTNMVAVVPLGSSPCHFCTTIFHRQSSSHLFIHPKTSSRSPHPMFRKSNARPNSSQCGEGSIPQNSGMTCAVVCPSRPHNSHLSEISKKHALKPKVHNTPGIAEEGCWFGKHANAC